MFGIRARELCVFHGTREEDAADWLKRFEEITEINRWEAHRLSYVRPYLEGTARKWLSVTKPTSWEDFRRKFLDVFTQDFRFRLKARLRARRQGSSEPLITYFYDVLYLCSRLEEERGSPMSELDMVEQLLAGIAPELLESLWPLVPDTINTTTALLRQATKFSEAMEMAENAQDRHIGAITPKTPSQAELSEQVADLIQEVEDLQLELRRQRSFQASPHGMEVSMRDRHHPRRQFNPDPDYRQVSRPLPSAPAKYQTSQGYRSGQANRTADGRPICNKCQKPGYIARFCQQHKREDHTESVQVLHMTGYSLVKETVLCNGKPIYEVTPQRN